MLIADENVVNTFNEHTYTPQQRQQHNNQPITVHFSHTTHNQFTLSLHTDNRYKRHPNTWEGGTANQTFSQHAVQYSDHQ